MTAKLQSLKDKRAAAWEHMKEIRERGLDFSDLPAEDQASWDKWEAEIQRYSDDIDKEERAISFEASIEKVDRSKVNSFAGDIPEQRKSDEEYREVFLEFLRNGPQDLSKEQRDMLRQDLSGKELRALGIGTGAAGGYAVPQGFRDVIVERMKYFNAVRRVATVISTENGAQLPWPTNDDTGNVGAILAENTGLSQQDVVLGQEVLNAYMYTSKLVLVSYQLLQDVFFDVESFLGRKFGQRLGRIQNQHFTTGTGTSQPTGLITGGTARTAATGNTVTITYAELVNTIYAVDPAYREGGNCKWMWSDTAAALIRKLVDGQQRPLWEPSVQAGAPTALLGYPLITNNDLAVPAASAKTGAFGDFEAGYVIRDVVGMQTVRLNERYADALQVGFFAFQRTDATVQDTSAFIVFQQSAS